MSENIYKILGRRVREERKRSALTLEALAEKAGISGAFVAHIEAGRKNASLETVSKLAEALDLSLGELLGGTVQVSWGRNQTYLQSFARVLRNKTSGQKEVLVKLAKTAGELARK